MLVSWRWENQHLNDRITTFEQAQREEQRTELDANRQTAELEQLNYALRQEVIDLRTQLSERSQPQMRQLEQRHATLRDQFINLQARKKVADHRADRNKQLAVTLDQQLTQKEAQIQDLKRHQTGFTDYQKRTNQYRVRAVEKRYLEALMRLASYNAFAAIQQLKVFEILRRAGRDASYKPYQDKLTAAKRFANDYYRHIKTIAEETDKSLFPEVKKKLDDWYQGGLNDSIDPKQRLTLDHMEQDIRDKRTYQLSAAIVWDRLNKRLPQYKIDIIYF